MDIAATSLFLVAVLRLCHQCRGEGLTVGLTALTDPVVHGEGPHWDPIDNVLYYVDITGNAVHRYDPATKKDQHITFDKPLSLVLPIQGHRNKFVISLGLDLVVLTWDWDSGFNSTSSLVSVQGSPADRFNDGKADSRGRICAGTMGREDKSGVEMDKGTFYRVDNNPNVSCRAESQVSPVSISNGLAWTADDRTLYYIDTPTRRVDAFDYDSPSGAISNRRPVFEFGDVEGSPDGMTIDSDGNLWIACWGGSQVIQVNPSTGKLMRKIKLPAERITSAVFGGPKLDILYVTSMSKGLTREQHAKQPLAGTVWEVTGLNTTGTPSKPAVVNCKCN